MAKTSELEAVNDVLEAISQAPLSSLAAIPTIDGRQALNRLRQVSTEIQAKGWYFNTNYDFELPVSLNGEVILPAATLYVDIVPSGIGCGAATERNGKLFNVETNSFDFGDYTVVRVDLVQELPWDHLQEVARRAIVTRAARRFAQRKLGDPNLAQYTADDERLAHIELRKHDNKQADRKMVQPHRSIHSTGRATGRRTVISSYR